MSEESRGRPDAAHAAGHSHDADLLARMRAGDEQAFTAILHAEWDALIGYAAASIDDLDAAEDFAQEAFVRFWQRRRRWRSASSARAILFRIVRNLAFNERRRTSVRRRWNVQCRIAPPPGAATPAQIVEARELEVAVARAIQDLPERRREVFLLVRFHDLSYRDAAEVMDIAPRTVANQMSAALEDLTRALAPWLDQTSVRRLARAERGRL